MTGIATDAPLSLYNTLTRRTEPLVPGEPGHVRMYLCGVTVYKLVGAMVRPGTAGRKGVEDAMTR
jgi:hypothetical protein